MLKFKGERRGRPIYGFGLTEENVERLKAGDPILADLAEMGGPEAWVTIFYGRTLEDLAEAVRPSCDRETEFVARNVDDEFGPSK